MNHVIRDLPGIGFRMVALSAALLLIAGSVHGAFSPAVATDMIEPRFPLDAAVDGLREGSATIIVEIDANGQLNDWLPLSTTHPGFVTVLSEVLHLWTFQPATRDGEAVRSSLPLKVQFRSDGLITSVSRMQVAANIIAIPLGDLEEKSLVVKLKELDRVPALRQAVSPAYPPSMTSAAKQAAVFSLYIDTEGRVRMPMLIQSSGDMRLDLAAYDALLQWRFEPPTKRGKPVIAVAEQAFNFTNQARRSSESAF